MQYLRRQCGIQRCLEPMAAKRATKALGATAILSLLQQAAAFPALYDKLNLCFMPIKGYGAHKTPRLNPAITLELTDMSGAPVMAWEAGGEYTLTVTPYDADAPTNAWIDARFGTMVPADTATHSLPSDPSCPNAIFTTAPVVGPHVVMWTAPVDGFRDCCARFSTAQASGATTGYEASLLALPGPSSGPCDPQFLHLAAYAEDRPQLVPEEDSVLGADAGHDDNDGAGQGRDHTHSEGDPAPAGTAAAAPAATVGAAEQGVEEVGGAAGAAAWSCVTGAAAVCLAVLGTL
eukprot:jgi/Ulvmu1/2552/UM014_0002.1